MKTLTPTVLVHGPAGCGKTRNAEAIRQHFGCEGVIDEWDPQGTRFEFGHLHLMQSKNLTLQLGGIGILPSSTKIVSYEQLQKEGVVS
jgi:hypothetical protein